MAATLKGIIPESRQAANTKGEISYRETYQVVDALVTDNQYTIGSLAGIPRLGHQHAADDRVWCVGVFPRCVHGYKGWEVDVEYNSDRLLHEDPLKDELKVSYSGELYEVPLWADAVTGKPACNSAGDYFVDPTLTTDRADLIAHISLNVAGVPDYVLDLQSSVNSTTIRIVDRHSSLTVPAGLAKFALIPTIGDYKTRNDIIYYPIRFDIHLRGEGWQHKPLDAGFRELNYQNKLVNIKNEGDDEEVTSPAPLRLGKAITNPSPSNNVLLPINKYKLRDLRVLPGVE